MQDPWNPEKDELRLWAYDPASEWPDQDFDLSVAELWFSDLIIELAGDEACPRSDFFLGCAYLIVGDAVMTDYRTRSKEEIEHFLEAVKTQPHERLTKLYKRSIDLINNPGLFDYDLWCSAGYAKEQS